MKPWTIITVAVLLCLAGLAGCGGKERHDSGKEPDGHSHEEEAPGGATFKPGTGVLLKDETRKILHVEVASVAETKLPREIEFNLQIFGQKHHHALGDLDHTGCDVHGSGFVSTNTAAFVTVGQPVQITNSSNLMLTGVVLTVTKALALGDAEIVVGVSNAAAQLKPGDFVNGRITIPRDQPVAVVPAAAVLKTSEGTFVYAANDDAFLRTAVKTGAEANGLVEIMDGLLPGDQVVTRPVETFWLIELRATKGGGHSH